MTQVVHKNTKKNYKSVDIAVQCRSLANVKHLGKTAKNWMHQSLPKGMQKQHRPAPKENDSKRHRTVHETCQGNDKSEALTREFNVIRSKVSNFHRIRLVIIAK